MELEQPSVRDEEHKSSHKTKKRKHTDPGQSTSSKKRKHLDASLENAQDTPAKSKPLDNALESPPSSPPVPATLPDSDHDISLTDAPSIADGTATTTSSPFHTTTLSLYLPLPAIALSATTALPSLLTTHLTPLLLTYYPPLRGIVLSISNPILSSKKPQPNSPPSHPIDAESRTVLAHCADTDGLSYVWLTATFLLFRPRIRDELEGWLNVCSEGFVGLVCYNYFQVAVARNRIPRQWKWIPPSGEAMGKMGRKKKGKRTNDADEDATATSQETLVHDSTGTGVEEHESDEEREAGYFQREDASRVKGSIRFSVRDCEIVPGHDREGWSLQIEATLLSVEEEERVLEEERQKALRRQGKAGMALGR